MIKTTARSLFLLFAVLVSGAAPAAAQPARIAPESVVRAKQATVYLSVTLANGQSTEGSGFLIGESGVLVTNAHVVGMLLPNAKQPTSIEVVYNSGEVGETKTTAKLLGVDRTSDLAVLAIEGKQPAPLQLALKDDLVETQSVYIFGFPFGARLGKNITVSESSISSLRKDASGALQQIQVNGGMHPGNSGGPVVNTQGQVIGVAVSGIQSTQINFAVPAPQVQSLLDGRIQEASHGELFRQKDDVHAPLRYLCLDPFTRIKEVRVDVWTGAPSDNRKFAKDKALPEDGDGPRQTHALKYANAAATADVPLPGAAEGQVVWVQPVVVFAKGAPHYAAPHYVEPALAVKRVPALLQMRLDDQKERSVQFESRQTVSVTKGKLRFSATDTVQVDVLESFGPDAKGALVQLGFSLPKISLTEDGKKRPILPQTAVTVQRIAPRYVIGPNNQIHTRFGIGLNPKLDAILREQINDYYTQICNAYEASNIILPNRQLQPRETWPVDIPMLIKSVSGKSEVYDLKLTCTYEGVRSRLDKDEAVVNFTGRVEGRKELKGKVNGHVAGKFAFDEKRGFITWLKTTLGSEASSPDNSVNLSFTSDITLSRVAGNPFNLAIMKPPPPAPTGDVLVKQTFVLSTNDPADTKFADKGSKMKAIPVQLEKDKKYSIVVSAQVFDPYVRLLDPAGKIVAEDDNSGGGTTSRIEHIAAAEGVYKIVVTATDGKRGAFVVQAFGEKGTLLVMKEKKTKEKTKPIDPKAKPKDDTKVTAFKKPANSDTPITYLKVVSSPGEFVGQGKNYDYKEGQLEFMKSKRGILVKVDGWTLDLSPTPGSELGEGHYANATRHPFNKDTPGMRFGGNGRGNNKIIGEFVIWELVYDGDTIARLAVDFVQRGTENGPPLTGRLRLNSKFE